MNDAYEMDTTCPWCFKVNEISTNMLNNGGPREHDVSLCWTCGGLSRFTDQLTLVPMDLMEQTEYLQSEAYQAYLRVRFIAKVRGQ
jgi:hypothetical protein